MIEFIKNRLPWILSAVLIFLLFFSTCGDKNNTSKVIIKRDTTYITKTIKIPEIKQIFVTKNPKPTSTIVIPETKDTIRGYNQVYKDSTGLVEVQVKDSITGKLLSQNVSFKVKEQEIKYKEVHVTETKEIKLKPKFVLSAGIKTQIGINNSVGVEVSIKNKKGYNLDLGINSNKDYTIGIKKDIFTLWGK